MWWSLGYESGTLGVEVGHVLHHPDVAAEVGRTEIDELDRVGHGEQDVGGLEVAVQDLELLEEAQGLHEFDEDIEDAMGLETFSYPAGVFFYVESVDVLVPLDLLDEVGGDPGAVLQPHVLQDENLVLKVNGIILQRLLHYKLLDFHGDYGLGLFLRLFLGHHRLQGGHPPQKQLVDLRTHTQVHPQNLDPQLLPIHDRIK